MTNQDRLDALNDWQRSQFNMMVAAKMQENWIPRNAAAVTAILDSVEGTPDPWAQQPVEPAQDETPEVEVPETPQEPTAGDDQ